MPQHDGTPTQPVFSVATWDDYTAATVPLGIREEEIVTMAITATTTRAYEYYDVPL